MSAVWLPSPPKCEQTARVWLFLSEGIEIIRLGKLYANRHSLFLRKFYCPKRLRGNIYASSFVEPVTRIFVGLRRTSLREVRSLTRSWYKSAAAGGANVITCLRGSWRASFKASLIDRARTCVLPLNDSFSARLPTSP